MSRKCCWTAIAFAAVLSACGGSGGEQEFRAPAENQSPIADFTVSPTSGKEPLVGVSFDASRSNDADGTVDGYAWDFGDGTTGSGRVTTHDFMSEGTYTVALTVTDNDGASSTNSSMATITVEANQPPVAAFNISPMGGQPSPSTVTFDASASNDPDGSIVSYDWDFGNGTTDSGVIVTGNFDNPGIAPLDYTITLTVTDDSGFTTDITGTVTVLPVNQAPQATFSGCPIVACANPGLPPFYAPYEVVFDASASTDIDGSIDQYEWDFGDGDSIVKSDPADAAFRTATHEYVASGSFTVTLTVTDNFGKSDTVSVALTIDNLPPVAAVAAAPEQGLAPLNVTFDASASDDPDGAILEYRWYFGDGLTGAASIDPDTGEIVDSTVSGVGNGSGITATHRFSNLGSRLSARGIPSPDTTSIASGDVDGDGVADVLLGKLRGINHLFRSPTASNPLSTRLSHDVSSVVETTLGVALADLNADGFDDLVTANGIVAPDGTLTGEENNVFLWDELSGGFSSPQPMVPGDLGVSTSVVEGDFNNDLLPDMIVTNLGAADRVYFGDGAGGFSSAADISADITDSTAAVVVDVDGDSDLDVIVANAGSTNRLYLGDGTGSFSAGTDISGDIHGSTSLATADVDGDGDPDIVVGNAGGDGGELNFLYLNQCGSGCAADTDVFAGVSGIAIAEDAEVTTSVVLDDFDGDGDVDLVAGNSLQPSRLYLNFRDAAPFDGILFNDRVVDDPDCDPDVAATCDCDLQAPVAEACTTEPVASGQFLFESELAAIHVLDIDANAAPDLIAGNLGTDDNVFMNTCSGSCTTKNQNPFTGSVPTLFPRTDVRDIALGDVDGDGDLDAVMATANGPSRLLRSTPSLAFALTSSIVSSRSDSTQSVYLADMDADGDLDLVTGNAGQANKFYVNGCNGVCAPDTALFTDATLVFDIGSDLANTGSIAIGDVDGDGDLDVVAGNGVFGNQPNRVFINLCTEAFGIAGCPADANVFDPDPALVDALFFDVGDDPAVTGDLVDLENSQSIALGDIDGDGDLDLVVGNDSQPNRYYLNSCNGSCATGDNPFPSDGIAVAADDTFATQSIRLADIDGDLDLDILAGNAGQRNRLYLNGLTGSGVLSYAAGIDIGSESDTTFDIAVGDINGDGLLDIVTGNDGVNRAYYGAVGGFSSSTTGIDVTTDDDGTRSVGLVEVNDIAVGGRLDLVVGNAGSQSRIYYNDGVHVVTLRVVDNAGASSETAVTIEAQAQ